MDFHIPNLTDINTKDFAYIASSVEQDVAHPLHHHLTQLPSGQTYRTMWVFVPGDLLSMALMSMPMPSLMYVFAFVFLCMLVKSFASLWKRISPRRQYNLNLNLFHFNMAA